MNHANETIASYVWRAIKGFFKRSMNFDSDRYLLHEFMRLFIAGICCTRKELKSLSQYLLHTHRFYQNNFYRDLSANSICILHFAYLIESPSTKLGNKNQRWRNANRHHLRSSRLHEISRQKETMALLLSRFCVVSGKIVFASDNTIVEGRTHDLSLKG